MEKLCWILISLYLFSSIIPLENYNHSTGLMILVDEWIPRVFEEKL